MFLSPLKLKLAMALVAALLISDNPVVAQTVEVLESQATINRVLEVSGNHFRAGLLDMKAQRHSEASDKFDKSIETFLLSKLNIQRDSKLQACYSHLVETIYRLEYPIDNQTPQLRPLAVTCGWNWNEADWKLADDVAVGLKPRKRTTTTDAASIASIVPRGSQNVQELSGFNNQVFDPSPLDELSKLELTDDERRIQSSSSTNSADGSPKAPQYPQNHVGPTTYSRPASSNSTTVASNVKVVKAQAGDTVSKLAVRNGADPTEVARYNGLLPNSVLSAGREIRIPSNGNENLQVRASAPFPRPELKATPRLAIGARPTVFRNGSVKVIVDYFNENLHDPYSMRILRWSPISQSSSSGTPCWRVMVRYRAKNLMGAYKLTDQSFCIRNNRIVSTFSLD